MKALPFFLLLSASFVWAQSAAPQAPPEKGDKVVATFDDGTQLTLEQWDFLVQLHPSWSKLSREEGISKYAILRKFTQLAQEKKLDQKSPYKEEIQAAQEFMRMFYTADALVQDTANSTTVDSAEVEKFYNDNKGIYKQVKVSAVRIDIESTGAADGASANSSRMVKKSLTEEQAKAKADSIVADLRKGADFCKTVLLESYDDTNKTKCGELTTLKMTDEIPAELRTTALELNKPGQISEPVKQGKSFYIFHADTVTYAPLKDVQDSIFTQVKNMHVSEWLQKLGSSVQVKFPDQKEPSPAAASDAKK